MYNQRYIPFSQKSEEGTLALKVNYTREEVEQHGRTFPVQVPWFTLEDVSTGKSLWCRRGNWRIDDPHAFFVSNDGWSVIHFHGRDRYARLTALSPEGQIVLTVGITGFDGDHANEPPVPEGRWTLWTDDHVSGSTAGVLWADRLRCRFFYFRGRAYFVCRTGWGRYLVMDLVDARVVDEKSLVAEELFLTLRKSDEEWALETLRQICNQREVLESSLSNMRLEKTPLPQPLTALWENAFVALHIVRDHRTKAATMLLEQLQVFSDASFSDFHDVSPLRNFASTFKYQLREHVHLAMLRVGVRPKGYALKIFNEVGDWSCDEPHWLQVPECVADRGKLLSSLRPGIKPRDVAFRVGAPEYIRDTWHDRETCPHIDEFHFECWDYDEPNQHGVAASWALLWRRRKTPMSPEEKEKSISELFFECFASQKDDESSEDTSNAELVSVTHFVWDEAYWIMREENIPLSCARDRLAKANASAGSDKPVETITDGR